FPQLGRRLPAQADLDLILDVTHVQPIPSGARPIDLQTRLRYLARAIDERALDAANRAHCTQHLLRALGELHRIVTEDLHHDLAVDLRDALQHVVANRLREA